MNVINFICLLHAATSSSSIQSESWIFGGDVYSCMGDLVLVKKASTSVTVLHAGVH